MTLLHHITYDGNIEALKVMFALPYFKDIVDSDENEVSKLC